MYQLKTTKAGKDPWISCIEIYDDLRQLRNPSGGKHSFSKSSTPKDPSSAPYVCRLPQNKLLWRSEGQMYRVQRFEKEKSGQCGAVVFWSIIFFQGFDASFLLKASYDVFRS